MEREADNQLLCVDVTVKKDEHDSVTEVYCKDTFTRLGLKYMSFVSLLLKLEAIKTSICKAFDICSSVVNFDMEVETWYFTSNG